MILLIRRKDRIARRNSSKWCIFAFYTVQAALAHGINLHRPDVKFIMIMIYEKRNPAQEFSAHGLECNNQRTVVSVGLEM